MKSPWLRFSTRFLLFVALTLWTLVPGFAEPVKFVLIHTSDMHGHISPAADTTVATGAKPMVGGVGSL